MGANPTRNVQAEHVTQQEDSCGAGDPALHLGKKEGPAWDTSNATALARGHRRHLQLEREPQKQEPLEESTCFQTRAGNLGANSLTST